ncbi:hypothetical protein ART_2328 [Arthrobacter sp. PAMC 25486]|nr:hypothetical protein ART_2328 [Arthrobacter sp. PAMC 25486]
MKQVCGEDDGGRPGAAVVLGDAVAGEAGEGGSNAGMVLGFNHA